MAMLNGVKLNSNKKKYVRYINKDKKKIIKKKMWLIYASELAACIGENKYKKKWESFFSIFQRIDDGQHYQTALSRLKKSGYHVATETEKIKNIIISTGVQPAVNLLINASTNNSVQLQENISQFENQLTKTEQEFKNKKIKIKNELSQERALQEETSQICHNLKNDFLLSSPKMPAHESELLKQEIQTYELKNHHLDQQVNQKLQSLQQHEEEWDQFKTMKSRIIGQKQTSFGQTKENEMIESRVVGVVVENNAQFYKKIYGSVLVNHHSQINHVSWGIGGRIDGFRDGMLIEIKNRKNYIFDPLPIYDYIQIQAYMQLLEVNSATVIQCLTTNENQIEKKEINVQRDDFFWEQRVMKEIKIFIRALVKFVGDWELQNKFFQALDTKKSFVINALFKQTKKEMESEI